MTTRQAVASYFLKAKSATFGDVVNSTQVSLVGTTSKTVRNVLGMLVAEGLLKKTSDGYAARNKRKLSSVLN